MVKEKRPVMVFLMETLLCNKKAEFFRIKLQFDYMFVVDKVGRSGGLILLWNNHTNVMIHNFSRRHINAIVTIGRNGILWKFSGFYGHPVTAKRYESWGLLRHLSGLSPTPWLCMGDFNEIVSMSEIKGSTIRAQKEMEDFQNALANCQLCDLGFNGPKYTWNNGREGAAFTKERLDKAVANSEWRMMFENVEVQVMARRSSDHHPLLLSFNDDNNAARRKKGFFRMEANWAKRTDFMETIKNTWAGRGDRRDPWRNLKGKMANCQKTIKVWVRKAVQATEKQIQEKSRELVNIQMEDGESTRKDEAMLKGEIQDLLEQEEGKWKQRAKEDWLRCGDRNTKYFHACATQKKRRNTVEQIKNEEGILCSTPEAIEGAFVNYYSKLFTSASPRNVEACTSAITGKVTVAMNNCLLATFTMAEIKQALDQMAPFKAPGLDGFTAEFYQQNWEIVGPEVCEAALHFLNSGHMDSAINATNIALIPKVKTPNCVSEFRPISLCNVLYKIVSKVLANRLKVTLPMVISPNQSAFLPGRLITDNILAAYETLHTMQTRLWSKVGFMGIKLDMSKAYDRVEWDFLEAVMVKMGFAERWISLIMACVRSVTYSIVVNGVPVGNIKPTRGLRQGDPISPYLFLICAEALSAMLCKAESTGVITGVPTSKRGPKLTHLFFADDSLLFCKANSVEWRRLTKILERYEEASGQKLNKDKTSIIFSRNTSQEKRDEISRLSGLCATQCYEKYLGLPTMVGRSRYNSFKSIKDRVWNRLNDWKVKFLSQAGKEILIKAVVQAIPTYCMSVFLLPNTLCKELNGLMQRFWWGHKENTSKIHWMSWERMGTAKERGGLGFRDLTTFNKALLAKQVWRILKNPESLVARIMKAKYFPHTSIMETAIGNRPSQAWRSIFTARDLVNEGAIWRIGNGEDVRVWGDKWLPTPTSFSVQSPRLNREKDMRVSNLIDKDLKQWNSSLIASIFLPEEAEIITNIPLSQSLPRDRLIWRCTKIEDFTVRSAYHLGKEFQARQLPECSEDKKEEEVWKMCWKLKIPNAAKMFLWRACHNSLPTKVNLKKRGVCENSLCPICLAEDETVEHIIWECPAASDVWGGAPIKLQKSTSSGGNFIQILSGIKSRCAIEEVELFAIIARRIWHRRNEVVHGGDFRHPMQMVREAITTLKEFQRANQPGGTQHDVSENRGEDNWKPPPVNTLKINWDAAVDLKKGIIGLGTIVRDERGEFVEAETNYRKMQVEPVVAETLAALQALNLCTERGYQSVIMEGDALQVINLINSVEPCNSGYGHLVEDIRAGSRRVGGIRFQHVRRTANKAAHELAVLARTRVTNMRWTSIPSCVSGIVRDERLLLPS
jgi:ribonuclease HI